MGPSSAWATALAGLAALALAMGIGRFAFTPILPMMQDDAGLTVADGGWLAAANYLGYLLGALSAIRVRVRPEPAIRRSLLLISLSTMAMALPLGFAAWFVLRLLPGAASAWVLVFVSAWALERLASEGRPTLGGLVYGGVGAGIFLAGMACLVLLGMRSTSSTAWFALGAISLGFTALLWNRFEPSAAADAARGELAASGVTGFRWSLVLCYGAFGFAYIVPATFLPVMARQAIADPQAFGWAWPVFGAAALASTVLASALGGRFGRRRVWIGANLVMAAGVFVPVVTAGLAGTLIAALCVGGTFMVMTMIGLQEARALAGPGSRPLIAAMTVAFAAGQIAGPLVAGAFVRDGGDFSLSLSMAAFVLLLSAFTLHTTKGTDRDHDGTEVARRKAGVHRPDAAAEAGGHER